MHGNNRQNHRGRVPQNHTTISLPTMHQSTLRSLLIRTTSFTHRQIHPHMLPHKHRHDTRNPNRTIQKPLRLQRKNDQIPSRTHRRRKRLQNTIHPTKMRHPENSRSLHQPRRTVPKNKASIKLLPKKTANSLNWPILIPNCNVVGFIYKGQDYCTTFTKVKNPDDHSSLLHNGFGV